MEKVHTASHDTPNRPVLSLFSVPGFGLGFERAGFSRSSLDSQSCCRRDVNYNRASEAQLLMWWTRNREAAAIIDRWSNQPAATRRPSVS